MYYLMRAANEKYTNKEIKDSHGYPVTIFPTSGKDLFGYKIEKGAFVIWQPYSAHDGMHIGQVISIDIQNKWLDCIKIKTADNKTITRHGYELVLVMQQRMAFENTLEEE